MATRTRRPRPYKAPPPDTSPCHPSGPLAPLHGQVGPTGACSCGDQVTQHWSDEARDWQAWSDVDGTLVRSVPKPPVHPAVMAQMRGNRKITPEMLESYEATHYGWGVLWNFPLHWHRIDPATVEPYADECPTCHGWPMQAVADGWRCRITSRIHITTQDGDGP